MIDKRLKIIFLLLLLVVVPFTFVSAATITIVPCGSKTPPNNDECDFDDIIELIKNIIDFIILISAPIGAIMFSYAGFLYLTAAGNSGQVSRANSIFWTVFVGFIIILAAWLIVKSLTVLIEPEYSQLLGN